MKNTKYLMLKVPLQLLLFGNDFTERNTKPTNEYVWGNKKKKKYVFFNISNVKISSEIISYSSPWIFLLMIFV